MGTFGRWSRGGAWGSGEGPSLPVPHSTQETEVSDGGQVKDRVVRRDVNKENIPILEQGFDVGPGIGVGRDKGLVR